MRNFSSYQILGQIWSSKVKFLFIAISGICFGIFEGFHGSQRAAPEPMCLPTMTQAGREHTTQFISLVHANTLVL